MRAIGGLGEIALRVRDLDAMQRFYGEVVGLELMRRTETFAFFRIAEGFGGHTQVLALFDRRGAESEPPRPEATSLDHLAFAIPLSAYASEKARLEGLGLRVDTAEHAWVQWRSLYVDDPEGNRVELVCFDASASDGVPILP